MTPTRGRWSDPCRIGGWPSLPPPDESRPCLTSCVWPSPRA
ncbi:MAG: hypothetical protein RL087_648, partial [Pseudomonadota bacterium]